MVQRALPFQFRAVSGAGGVSALTGLGLYLQMAQVMNLGASIRRHVRVREGGQGWSDTQMVMSLLMLNLAGGESVSDLRLLESDRGLSRMFLESERAGQTRAERRREDRRMRSGRQRIWPSASAVFRYLDEFNDPEQELLREEHVAFIPQRSPALGGLWNVNADMLRFVNSHARHSRATLDMDATLIATHKKQALYCYRKFPAYQPLTTYWAEADMVVHSEFRDGNVPAGYEQLRVLKEAIGHIPSNVKEVMLRSDTAGYQQDLLKYCAEGKDERFGVIEFAVGVPITREFRKVVSETPEDQWHPLPDRDGRYDAETGQQWAEVCMVPNWVGHKKSSPEYRFLAIREVLRNPPLPGMEKEVGLSTPAAQMRSGIWHKISGIVTNRDFEGALGGRNVIRWYRDRCGKGEEVHAVHKEDMAGGRMPSGQFGVNAAWWSAAVLASNLNSAVKHLALGRNWIHRRMKALRLHLINIASRVVSHARRLIISIDRDHASSRLLLDASERIKALAHSPPT